MEALLSKPTVRSTTADEQSRNRPNDDPILCNNRSVVYTSSFRNLDKSRLQKEATMNQRQQDEMEQRKAERKELDQQQEQERKQRREERQELDRQQEQKRKRKQAERKELERQQEQQRKQRKEEREQLEQEQK